MNRRNFIGDALAAMLGLLCVPFGKLLAVEDRPTLTYNGYRIPFPDAVYYTVTREINEDGWHTVTYLRRQ